LETLPMLPADNELKEPNKTNRSSQHTHTAQCSGNGTAEM